MSDVETVTPSRIILDPSFLLTEDALDWLGDPELQPWLVVSAGLVDRLRDPELLNDWAQFGPRPDLEQLERIAVALEPIERFSHRDFADLSEPSQVIRDALLEDGPFGEVFADEWVFVTTQSIGVLAINARRTLNRFVRAGARVFEATKEQMERGLAAITSHLPPRVLDAMKGFAHFPHRRSSYLLMLGGTIAGLFVPPAGLAMGIVGAVQMGTGVIAGDP